MRLLIGVTGGIAAYKACGLVSLALKAGHQVRVMMTPSAAHFVGPLTFEGLTGHPVLIDVLATGGGVAGASAVAHISWAKWPDRVCLAPLTASTQAKLACGLADNALTTVMLAVDPAIPRWLCPAMNTRMWQSPITQRNCQWLRDAGYRFVAPSTKRLACGDVGEGGLAEIHDILEALSAE